MKNDEFYCGDDEDRLLDTYSIYYNNKNNIDTSTLNYCNEHKSHENEFDPD